MPTKTSCGILSMVEQFDMFPSNVVPFEAAGEPMHRTNVGGIGEKYVVYLLATWGISATIFEAGTSFDVIAKLDKLIKVEVKTSKHIDKSSPEKMHFNHNRRAYDADAIHKQKHYNYKPGDYDILATYSLIHHRALFHTMPPVLSINVPKAFFTVEGGDRASWDDAIRKWRLTNG